MDHLPHRLGVLLLWPLLTGMASAECERVREAHDRLLAESFEVERRFELSMNGKPKRRELARLTSVEGVLETEVLEEEVLSKGLVLEGEGEDFVLGIGFSCDRLEALGEGRFELTSEDGLERAELELDPERGALRPVGWRLEARERFLFKKLLIEGRADYRGFRWLELRALDR